MGAVGSIPLSVERIKEAVRQVITETDKTETSVLTEDVVESFLRHKKHAGIEDESIKTYRKRLKRFMQQFPVLPMDTDTLIDYLSQFNGGTGRYKLNQQDLLSSLYNHSVRHFGVPYNPVRNLERPRVTKKQIQTLSLEEAMLVDSIVDNLTERASWELALGHGWRQIEIRRITAGDVRSISDGVILCRGKERDEFTPLLSDTQTLLGFLAEGLEDDECVIRSTRTRNGTTQSLGEKGLTQLFQRLFTRAGIADKKYTGHDLRRTFCTLVKDASDDECLAMRLARDKIPGVNDRYINTTPVKLKKDLLKYSPLRLIKQTIHTQSKAGRGDPVKEGESVVEAGEAPGHNNQ